MDNLGKFFQIPLIKFTVHFVLLFGLLYNLYYFYEVWKIEKDSKQIAQVNQIIQREIEENKKQAGYQNSEWYIDKAIKQDNYKNIGEEVVDTSSLEPFDPESQGKFIPTLPTHQKTNPEKWINCLFGRRFDISDKDARTKYIESPCRGS